MVRKNAQSSGIVDRTYTASSIVAKPLKAENQAKNALSNKIVLEMLVWIVLVASAWAWTLNFRSIGFEYSIAYSCALSIFSGVRIFVAHGLGTVTATGLFGLSTSIFIGYSGLVLMSQENLRPELDNLALAVLIGLTVQIFTVIIAWGASENFKRSPFYTRRFVTRWLTGIGSVSLILSILAHLVLPQMGLWTESAAFTAICVTSAGLIFRERVTLFSWNTLLALALLFLYAEYFHSGSGRLRIVALACALAVIVSARFPLQRFKVGIVALLPLAIAWLANSRLNFQESLSTGSSTGRTGLESMTAPLEVFSLLLDSFQEQRFVPVSGYNLLSVFAIVVPESVWPKQPVPLGYELVQFVDPEKYGDSVFSTAATSIGEGVFNFGWFGIPIVVIFAAAILRMMDSLMIKRLRMARSAAIGVLGIVLAAMLAGAVADYTWSGVHTYVARMIARLPVFILILILARMNVTFRKSNRRQLY